MAPVPDVLGITLCWRPLEAWRSSEGEFTIGKDPGSLLPHCGWESQPSVAHQHAPWYRFIGIGLAGLASETSTAVKDALGGLANSGTRVWNYLLPGTDPYQDKYEYKRSLGESSLTK